MPYKLSEAGKRFLENPKTQGHVWKGKVRIHLATATQEQLELLYNDGKGSLVVKVADPKPAAKPPADPAPEKEKEKSKEKL